MNSNSSNRVLSRPKRHSIGESTMTHRTCNLTYTSRERENWIKKESRNERRTACAKHHNKYEVVQECDPFPEIFLLHNSAMLRLWFTLLMWVAENVLFQLLFFFLLFCGWLILYTFNIDSDTCRLISPVACSTLAFFSTSFIILILSRLRWRRSTWSTKPKSSHPKIYWALCMLAAQISNIFSPLYPNPSNISSTSS